MINSRLNNPLIFQINSTLGHLEKKVFYLVVFSPPSTVRSILKKINKSERKQYAYTTIMTVMDKLYKKGYLIREKNKKTYFYKSKFFFNDLINKNCFFVVYQIYKKFGFLKPLLFLNVLFFFNFLFLLNRKKFTMGILNSFFGFIFIILIVDAISNLYFQGFFEFIVSIIKDPKLFLNFFFLNIVYLHETFSLIWVLILFAFILYLFKNLKNKYYQFIRFTYGK